MEGGSNSPDGQSSGGSPEERRSSGGRGAGEPVRSRWTPKPEQILILESIFNSGMVNPPKDGTVRIRKLLERFGAVGDANVFYWFQNRRSRSRRRQRQMQAAAAAAAASSAAAANSLPAASATIGLPSGTCSVHPMAIGGGASQYEQQATSSSSSGSTGGSSLGLFAAHGAGVSGAGVGYLQASCGTSSPLASGLMPDVDSGGRAQPRRAAAVLLVPIAGSDDHGVHQRSPNGGPEGSNRLASHVWPGRGAPPLHRDPPPSQRLWHSDSEPANGRKLFSGNHPYRLSSPFFFMKLACQLHGGDVVWRRGGINGRPGKRSGAILLIEKQVNLPIWVTPRDKSRLCGCPLIDPIKNHALDGCPGTEKDAFKGERQGGVPRPTTIAPSSLPNFVVVMQLFGAFACLLDRTWSTNVHAAFVRGHCKPLDVPCYPLL
uniref:WUSCHEL-related homeobox 6 n=1 Tax=Aegilops tauschii TaxID=37682 RepID=M8CH34_AEGTA